MKTEPLSTKQIVANIFGCNSEDIEQTYQGVEQEIDEALKSLTPREEEVLRQRWGLNPKHTEARQHTLRELAELWGLSRERIRQIDEKGLCKLRHPIRLRPIKAFTHFKDEIC